jgi:hypothetical protein
MHYGKITGNTTAARMLRMLLDATHTGAWLSSLQLGIGAQCVNPSGVISEIRHQIPCEGFPWEIKREQRKSLHFYRVVRVFEDGQLNLFEGVA